MTLALVVLLRYRCSSRVEPAALRVRRVRLNLSEDVRSEGVKRDQFRISDRRASLRNKLHRLRPNQKGKGKGGEEERRVLVEGGCSGRLSREVVDGREAC